MKNKTVNTPQSWQDAETPEDAARLWFGVPIGPISKSQRSVGKQIIFGTQYGIQPATLMEMWSTK